MSFRKFLFLFVLVTIGFHAAAQLCEGSLGDPIVNITFGAGPSPGPSLGNTTNMQYIADDCPNDGMYTVRGNTTRCFANTWHSISTDHTGDPNGYFMLINASLQKSEFYVDTVRGLCPGTTYEFAAWVMNVIQPFACSGNTIPPNLTFNIETPAGVILNTYSTGDIAASSIPKWNQTGFFFTTPSDATNVVLRIINNSQGGCGNDLALDDITFRPCGAKLTPSFIDGTPGDVKNLCFGDAADIFLTCDISQGFANPSYQWQQSTNDGTSWTDIAGANTTMLERIFTPSTPVADYSYRLTVVEATNNTVTSCRVASGTLKVLVHGMPVINAANNGPLCEGSPLILSAAGGAQYVWTGVNGFSSSEATITIANPGSANVGKYYVTVTTSDGCVAEDSTTVDAIRPRPIASVGFGSATICSGTGVALSSSGGVSYLWSPAAGLSNANISNPFASPSDSTQYKVLVSNMVCTDSAFVTVNVIASPKADAGPDQAIVEGQSVLLPGTASGSIAGILWSPASHIDDVKKLQPTVEPVVNTRYILTAFSANGCGIYTDSVMVHVYKKVIVPNAFSPNNDGTNDTWRITALNTYDDYDLLVFNRYGNVVFQSKNYANNWSGTYNGKPLPIGTYYYYIDLRHDLPKLRGSVTILR